MADVKYTRVRFAVEYTLESVNRVVALVGSQKCLGKWNTKKAAIAQKAVKGQWEVDVRLPSRTETYCNWAVLDCETKDVIHWEERETRYVWVVGEVLEMNIHCQWGGEELIEEIPKVWGKFLIDSDTQEQIGDNAQLQHTNMSDLKNHADNGSRPKCNQAKPNRKRRQLARLNTDTIITSELSNNCPFICDVLNHPDTEVHAIVSNASGSQVPPDLEIYPFLTNSHQSQEAKEHMPITQQNKSVAQEFSVLPLFQHSSAYTRELVSTGVQTDNEIMPQGNKTVDVQALPVLPPLKESLRNLINTGVQTDNDVMSQENKPVDVQSLPVLLPLQQSTACSQELISTGVQTDNVKTVEETMLEILKTIHAIPPECKQEVIRIVSPAIIGRHQESQTDNFSPEMKDCACSISPAEFAHDSSTQTTDNRETNRQNSTRTVSLQMKAIFKNMTSHNNSGAITNIPSTHAQIETKDAATETDSYEAVDTEASNVIKNFGKMALVESFFLIADIFLCRFCERYQ